MFVSLARVCVVYVVKEVASFRRAPSEARLNFSVLVDGPHFSDFKRLFLFTV